VTPAAPGTADRVAPEAAPRSGPLPGRRQDPGRARRGREGVHHRQVGQSHQHSRPSCRDDRVAVAVSARTEPRSLEPRAAGAKPLTCTDGFSAHAMSGHARGFGAAQVPRGLADQPGRRLRSGRLFQHPRDFLRAITNRETCSSALARSRDSSSTGERIHRLLPPEHDGRRPHHRSTGNQAKLQVSSPCRRAAPTTLAIP
jgi:hypothetical protein